MALTENFKNECERIRRAWEILVYGKDGAEWSKTTYDQLNEKIETGKDKIYNDPFFTSFRTRTTEEQKYFLTYILTDYYDTANKNIGWVARRLIDNKDIIGKPYEFSIVYNSWGLLNEFLNVVDGNTDKIKQLQTDLNTAQPFAKHYEELLTYYKENLKKDYLNNIPFHPDGLKEVKKVIDKLRADKAQLEQDKKKAEGERDTAINELNPVKEFWSKNLKERLKGEISIESLAKVKKAYEAIDRIEANLKELDQAWIDYNLVEFGGDLDVEALKGIRKELDRTKNNKIKLETELTTTNEKLKEKDGEITKLKDQISQQGNQTGQSAHYLNKLLAIYKAQITQATQAFYLNDLGLDESDNINPNYWGKEEKDKSYLEKLNELNGDSDPEQVIIAFKWVALIGATEKAQEISNKWVKSPLAKKLKDGKLKHFESVKKYWDILKGVEPTEANNPLYLKKILDKSNVDFWKENLNEIISTWQAF